MTDIPEFAGQTMSSSARAQAALAYRLSENGRHSVIVLEHGGTDAGPLIQMPAALSYPMNMSRYDWGYQSEPSRIWAGGNWPARAAR